jgi:hypothetical protein
MGLGCTAKRRKSSVGRGLMWTVKYVSEHDPHRPLP